jgi:SAM-dependent methyltransferase
VTHRDLIVDQFTRQAGPFASAPGIRDEEALRRLVEAAGTGPDDDVLDVACGPGLVTCAFAAVARRATGIDVTPAMVAHAERLAAERGLRNVAWRVADVQTLPFPDAAFSVVVSRFAFHHFEAPGGVLAEMRRVCRPGGRVVVADVIASPDPRKADGLNRMERLRDPSHVRAMPLAELIALFASAGLPPPASTFYNLESDLEGLLSRSFPAPGDDAKVRALFEAAVADDGLGLAVRRQGGHIRFAYPVAILRALRPL